MSKFFKILAKYGVPIVGIVMGVFETIGGVKDLIEAHNSPEETTEEKDEESV